MATFAAAGRGPRPPSRPSANQERSETVARGERRRGTGRDALKRVLQRELNDPRIADRRVDLRQRTCVLEVRGRRIGERRMVSHVEKLGPEQHVLLLADAKGFANRQVHVRLMRPNEAIARNVAETRRAIEPDWRRRYKCGGVDKVTQPRLIAPRGDRVAASASGSETGREWRAAVQCKDGPSRGIQNRERRTRLHREHGAGLPATQRPPLDSARVFVERQFIYEARDGAMPVIEIREAAGAARIILIVEKADKRHADR